MKKNQRDKRPSHHPGSPEPLSKRRFTRPVILSLILHALLLIFLAINFKSFLPRSTTNYPVTLVPLGSSGEGTGGGGVPAPPTVEQTALPIETPKPEPKKPESKKPEPEKKQQSSKDQKPDKVLVKKDTVEGLKKTNKEKKAELVKDPDKSLQDAIAKMEKSVANRSTEGKSYGGQTGTGSTAAVTSSGKAGPGTGSGIEGSIDTGSVQAKVNQAWVLPANLPKTNNDLVAIIVVVIDRAGKVKNSRFEKKSGDDLFDQSAMRAIKKAEPFLPINAQLIDKEIGLVFDPSKK